MQSPLLSQLTCHPHSILSSDEYTVNMQRWSAWRMMYLGRGSSCSVPPVPKHRKGRAYEAEAVCVCGGLCVGMTYCLCWSWEASGSCRSQRGWAKLVLRTELPGRYIAEIFHSVQSLLHKDVSSLEMMQLSTCLRSVENFLWVFGEFIKVAWLKFVPSSPSFVWSASDLGILDGRGSLLWREVEGWQFLPD